jgi:hypothetical protein
MCYLSKSLSHAKKPTNANIASIESNSKQEIINTIAAASRMSPRSVAEDTPAAQSENRANKKESFLYFKFAQPLASRTDLDRFISDIPVGIVDAVLTPNFFACGRWVVRVDDQAVAKLMKRANDDVYGRVAIERITSYDYVMMNTAQKVRITNSSIRVQGHSPRMGRPELQYLFEDFGVTYKDIRLLQNEDSPHLDKNTQQQSRPHTFSGDWFVRFPTSELARSAYHQREGSIVRGHKLILTLYDI